MIVGTKINVGTGMNGHWCFESDDVNELRAAFGDYPWRVNERGKFEMPAHGGGWEYHSIAACINAHTKIVFNGADKDSIVQMLTRNGMSPLTDEEIARPRDFYSFASLDPKARKLCSHCFVGPDGKWHCPLCPPEPQ